MYAPDHPTDGLTLSGSLRVTPAASRDSIDLLDTVVSASLRAVMDERPSALLEQLAPQHPDGASGWLLCGRGCCLEILPDGYVQVDAIEPWLSYLVRTTLADHDVSGAVMIWDHAAREFTALTVDGTRVRRQAVLRGRRRADKDASGGSNLATLRSV